MQPHSMTNKAKNPSLYLAQKCVLIVDDDPLARDVLVLMLERIRLNVCTAIDGTDALEKCQTQHFDLLLMDCHMPEMDGYDATRQIRSLPAYKNTPIVALTADSFDSTIDRCHEAGMNTILTKPISQNELKTTLDSFFKPVPGQDATSQPLKTNQNAVKEQPPVSTIEQLRKLCESYRPSLVVQLINTYLENTPPLLEKLKSAVTDGDIEKIIFFSHRLKSSSAMLNLTEISHAFSTIQQLAEENYRSDQVQSILNPIVQSYHQLEQIMLQYKANLNDLNQ